MKKNRLIAAGATVLIGAALAVGAAAPASAGIKLYQFANYSTSLGDFGTGTSFVGSGADNKTTSLKVTSPANYAILYQFRDYSGAYTGTFYTGWSDLASFGYYSSDGAHFDNRTTSVG